MKTYLQQIGMTLALMMVTVVGWGQSYTFFPENQTQNVSISPIMTITFETGTTITFGSNKYIYIVNINDENDYYALNTGKTTMPKIARDPKLSITNNVLKIDFSSIKLKYNATYGIYTDIENPGAIIVNSASWNTLDNLGVWEFTTIPPPAPKTTFTPFDKTLGIDIYPTLKINYDMAVRNLDGITAITNINVENLITLKDASNNTVSASDYVTTINSTKDTITIVVRKALSENIKYTITVLPVENNVGQEQTATQTSTFYTAKYNKWLGGSTAWEVPTNWSDNSIPSDASFVLIQNAGSFDPVINTSTTILNMIINADAALTIGSTATLTLDNTLKMFSTPSINASLLINGSLVVKENVEIHQGITQTAWDYYISSPVAGATTANTGCDGEIYARANNGWSLLSSKIALLEAHGYSAWGSSGSEIIYKGVINNSDSYGFTANRTVTPNNFGWSLAGNPYPCAINWEVISTSNLTDGFWLPLNSTGGFGTYNGKAELGTNVSKLTPSEIPSGHAFWVQVLLPNPNTVNTTGSLTITKDTRMQNTISYLKSEQSTINKSVLRFVGFNGDLEDEMVTAFVEGANNELDAYDSEKIFSSNVNMVQLFSLAEITKCAINSFDLNKFDGKLTIPVGYKMLTPTSIEKLGIGLKSITGFPEDLVVELEDTYKKQTQVLTPNSSYCFASTPDPIIPNSFLKEDPNRFLIHLKSASASTVIKNPTESTIKVFAKDKTIVIEGNTFLNSSYEIIDINGQIINNGHLILDGNTVVPVSKTGIVIVKINTPERNSTSKILIK